MAVDTITHDDIIEEEPEDVDDLENDSEAEQDEFEYQEKIIIPSPKVSIDENDIPIIVNNKVEIRPNRLTMLDIFISDSAFQSHKSIVQEWRGSHSLLIILLAGQF